MMLVVSRHLFELLSHPNEAVLTDARTVLMQKKTIAKLASDAGLLDWLKQQGVVRDSAFWYQAIDHLKMTTNALIAMVYLDLGMEVAAELILRLFDTQLNKHDLGRKIYGLNIRGRFDTLIRRKFNTEPIYQTIQNPKANQGVYCIGVFIKGELIATGNSKLKKNAIANAAFNAFQIYKEK